jgi:ferrous iron transport protein B
LLDLPGTYSLDPHSPDEQIATDFVTGRERNPDLVVCVVDATHLERNLFLATQIIEQRRPLIIALTLSDAAEAEGTTIDSEMLSRELDVPVIPVVATQHRGVEQLRKSILHPPLPSRRVMCWQLPAAVEREVSTLAQRITHSRSLPIDQATSSAVELLSASSDDAIDPQLNSPELVEAIRKARAKIEFLGGDRHSIFIEARYAWIRELCHRAVSRSARAGISFTDRVDRFATHRVWGPIIFMVFMTLMFQSIFSWATFPMEAIGSGPAGFGHRLGASSG